MVIRALVLSVIGAAAFAAVYFLAAPGEAPPGNTPQSVTQNAPPVDPEAVLAFVPPPDPTEAMRLELRPSAEAITPNLESAGAIRDVTPDNMTAGPRVTGTLARIDASAAAGAAPKARTERIYNVLVLSAGIVKARNREIRLAGATALDFDQRCGEGAAAWPCGRMARAALRSFIRGRAIDCEIPAGADKLPDPAACSVGGENIAEWLVAQGWAKRSGDDFEAAEKAARDAKLGLWSDKRPDGQPADVAASG